MINCRETARLLSEQRDRRLPWRRRMGLRLHLLLCSLCRTYAAQLSAVCGICHEVGEHAPDHAPDRLAPEKKEAIRNAMAREQ